MNQPKQSFLPVSIRRRLALTVSLAAGLLTQAGVARAGSLGLNFVDNGDGGVQDGSSDALGSSEIAGVPGYAQANWNNLGRWGQGISLKDSTGAASGVTTTWDSNNTWNSGAGTGTPDNELMNGYLDSTGQANWTPENPYEFWWNENKPNVYLKGLGDWLAAQGGVSYDVVIYADGDTDIGRISEYWIQSVTSAGNDPPTALGADLTPRVYLRDAANFSGTYTQVPLMANSAAAPGDGNYIVFTGLTADEIVLRTEDAGWDNAFRTVINGIQIVAVVPEPNALALWGLGGLACILARRRRA